MNGASGAGGAIEAGDAGAPLLSVPGAGQWVADVRQGPARRVDRPAGRGTQGLCAGSNGRIVSPLNLSRARFRGRG